MFFIKNSIKNNLTNFNFIFKLEFVFIFYCIFLNELKWPVQPVGLYLSQAEEYILHCMYTENQLV